MLYTDSDNDFSF